MQNKSTAMKKLQNILYQKEFDKDMSAISTDRKFQVRRLSALINTPTETNSIGTSFCSGGEHESK